MPLREILDALSEHYIMIIEIVGLCAMLNIGVHLQARTVRATKLVICLIVIEAVLFTAEEWTQTFTHLSIARPLLTATIYLIHPLILLCIMRMTSPISTRRLVLYATPLILSAPVLYTSQWTRLVFYYVAPNNYNGNGIFSYYPYVLCGIYLLLFVVHYVIAYLKYDRRIRAGIIYISFASAGGVVLHLLLERSTDYSTLFASTVALYYLYLYMHTAKIDTLTGMFNRQCYYADETKVFDRLTGVASADMNELKWINDTLGHDAGDEALQTLADCLTKTCGTQKRAYRIGGDEFAIFYLEMTEEEIRADVQQMRELIAATKYTCAFGFAMKRDGMDFASVMREADAAMFADKASIKQAVLAAGGTLHTREEN